MKRLFTLAALLAAATLVAQAQQPQSLPCGTQQAWERLVQQRPEAARRRAELERFTQTMLSAPAPAGTQDDDSVLVIPVVVHIIHNFGTENIPDAQVEDFIRVVNEDFSKSARDTGQVSALFKPIHGNVRIEFSLARLDPSGNCTIGITRTVSDLTMDGDDRVKDLVRWDPSRYLNVWVVNTIAFAGAYAYYPGAGPDVDGIVCRYTQFGSIGASYGSNFAARTMTHGIGHYLNLPHTWGDSNEPGHPANCSDDDGVADTPNTVGTSNQGCNLNLNTCGVGPDNVENYMDYSNCGRMFTLGQKARMRAAAFSSIENRNNLWSPANLIATGTLTRSAPPVCAPSISVPPFAYRVCPGQEVRFVVNVNNAMVPQTSFRWEFPGSSTPVSSQPYPRVTYVTPGVYPVRLKVFNAAGADSVVLDSSIVVRNSVARYALGDSETFVNPTFPIVSQTGDQFYEFESSNRHFRGWEQTTRAGASDNGSLRANLMPLGIQETYSVITPGFDLSGAVRPTFLVYKYAAAKRQPDGYDEFNVYMSNNCGINWNIRTRRTPSSVPSVYTEAAPVASPWVPAQSDFVEHYVNVDPYVGRSNVRFKFEVKAGGTGNAIYLDDIRVVTLPTAVSDREMLRNVEIAPNPANTLVEVALPNWPGDKPVRYELLSPLGQKALSGRSEGSRFAMDVSGLPAGVYLLSLEGQKVQRIVVE